MAGCLLFVCETLRSWFLYKSHVYLCQRLFELQEGDKNLIPPYVDDPIQVFQEACIEENIYRWVVFTLWLKTSSKPFYWFQKIQKRFPIPSILTLENILWHLEKSPQPKPS